MPSKPSRTPLANTALLLATALLCAAAVEGVSRLLLASPGPQPHNLTDLYHFVPDAYYGRVLPKGTSYLAAKAFADGSTCYNATYTIDLARRREAAPYRNTSSCVVLFGDSAAFGEGLQDEQTLQARLSQALGVDVFVYAVPGYGPQHALAKLETGTLAPEVCARPVGVYLLMPDHRDRAAGDTAAWWGYDAPYYRLESGAPVRHGSFRTGRPATTALYEAFVWAKRRSAFLRLANLELPPGGAGGEVRLASAILLRSRELFGQETGGQFLVAFSQVFDPNSTAQRYADFRRALANVSTLDYSGDFHADDRLACDPHPNAASMQRLAGRMAKDLQRYVGETGFVRARAEFAS